MTSSDATTKFYLVDQIEMLKRCPSRHELENNEWSKHEERMEFLDDLSDTIWDILDSRKE